MLTLVTLNEKDPLTACPSSTACVLYQERVKIMHRNTAGHYSQTSVDAAC